MATPKQEKLIKILLENLGNKGNTKTLGEMILEAGYEESMAKNPYQILNSETIKKGVSDVVEEMKAERDRAIRAMRTKDLNDVAYEKLSDVIDKMTKNIQLLGGKPTEITSDLSHLSDEELEKIASSEEGVSKEGTSKEKA